MHANDGAAASMCRLDKDWDARTNVQYNNHGPSRIQVETWLLASLPEALEIGLTWKARGCHIDGSAQHGTRKKKKTDSKQKRKKKREKKMEKKKSKEKKKKKLRRKDKKKKMMDKMMKKKKKGEEEEEEEEKEEKEEGGEEEEDGSPFLKP